MGLGSYENYNTFFLIFMIIELGGFPFHLLHTYFNRNYMEATQVHRTSVACMFII